MEQVPEKDLFKTAKVGDPVTYHYRYGLQPSVREIIKITPKQIHVGVGNEMVYKFKRSDGYRLGGKGRIELATPEALEEVETNHRRGTLGNGYLRLKTANKTGEQINACYQYLLDNGFL